MKTLIFCAETGYARVFQTSREFGLQACSNVTAPTGERRRFCRYLADEIESSCCTGTERRFLICGDPPLVSSVCQCLSERVRSLIIGIVPHNFTKMSVEGLRDYTSRVVAKWEYKHGQRSYF